MNENTFQDLLTQFEWETVEEFLYLENNRENEEMFDQKDIDCPEPSENFDSSTKKSLEIAFQLNEKIYL